LVYNIYTDLFYSIITISDIIGGGEEKMGESGEKMGESGEKWERVERNGRTKKI